MITVTETQGVRRLKRTSARAEHRFTAVLIVVLLAIL